MIEVVVVLDIKDLDSFVEYETAAIEIMSEYGGKLKSAFEPDSSNPQSRQEVHILEFPDLASLANYRADKRLGPMASLRSRAIAHSKVYVASRVIDYEISGAAKSD